MDADDWIRFLKYVEITEDCWIWTGALTWSGYGNFWLNGKPQYSHRIALSESLGRPLLPKMEAAHAPGICHNRACVNPEHLREATLEENQADRILDGTDIRGSKSVCAKLSEADVLKIRDDPRHRKAIAADFAISQQTVSDIKHRKRWAHL